MPERPGLVAETIPASLPVAVIAFGGNALAPRGDESEAQMAEEAARFAVAISPLLQTHRVLLVFGNGPQVGRLLLQSEAAAAETPPWSLAACGAASQGVIDYLLETALRAEIQRLRLPTTVVSLVTLVEIDPADPAFGDPTKPIGPFYDEAVAQRLMSERSFTMKENGGGWRRVVPSPQPIRILGQQALRALIDSGALVVAGGGGGVPVVQAKDGRWRGVEAVIDKDLTAGLLARQIGADRLVILTNVDHVERDFGRPGAVRLPRISPRDGLELLSSGALPAGSMGPKVQAAIEFVGGSTRRAVITSVSALGAALREEAGTWVVSD
jgi:carbamate kinase